MVLRLHLAKVRRQLAHAGKMLPYKYHSKSSYEYTSVYKSYLHSFRLTINNPALLRKTARVSRMVGCAKANHFVTHPHDHAAKPVSVKEDR